MTNSNIIRKANGTGCSIEQFQQTVKENGINRAIEDLIERIVSLEVDIEDLQYEVNALEKKLNSLEDPHYDCN